LKRKIAKTREHFLPLSLPSPGKEEDSKTQDRREAAAGRYFKFHHFTLPFSCINASYIILNMTDIPSAPQ